MAFMVILFCLCQVLLRVSSDDPHCPEVLCHPQTVTCQHPSYFSFGQFVCSGCNICIKQGSTVDSEGCPQMPCPDKILPGQCFQPWIRQSWILYDGKRCQTCESRLCNFTP